MRFSACRFVITTLVVLSLAGCGASQAKTHGTPTTVESASAATSWDTSEMPDPCRVISNTEVSNATGRQLNTGERLEGWPPLCEFHPATNPQNGIYVSDNSEPSGKSDFEEARQDGAVQTVNDVGDQAYWIPTYNALHALQGSTHLEVIVKLDGDTDQLQQATAIAKIALPRALPTN